MKRTPQGSHKGPGVSSLKTKPFCDCVECACEDCPDILNLLGITITEKSCDFGSKVAVVKAGKAGKAGETKKKRKPNKISLTPSLLGVLDDRSCACEVMARTVRDHVHANLGLPHRNERKEPTDEHDHDPQ